MSEKNAAFIRHCTQCNAPLDVYRKGIVMCDDCLANMGVEMRRHTPPRDFPADWSLDDKNAKARELGMSYGKFVALVHCGMIDSAALEKPKPVRFAGRRGRRQA